MIDLHCHSTVSDGAKTPTELVEMASSIGLHALALTDHDTLDGLAEFEEAGKSHPELECIPGVELACNLSSGDYCHIVGLMVDYHHPELISACNSFARWRDERNHKLVERLCELGYVLTYEDVLAEKGQAKDDDKGVIGRPHIAYALMRKGYFKTKDEVFRKMINRGCPAYVPREVLSIDACMKAIHAAGGLAIWAHPMSSRGMTNAKCARCVEEMQAHGLDGIEAFYSEHTETQIRNVLYIARKHSLLLSGGSDYHGTPGNRLSLGTGHGRLHVEDDLLVAMKKAVQRYRS